MLRAYEYPGVPRWPVPRQHRRRHREERERDETSTEPSYYYSCDKEKGVLEVELPGVQKENIVMEVHGHHLSISANRYKKDVEGKEKEKELVCAYQLELRLGHDADVEAVKGVGYNDGVLVVHVPTMKADQPRRITIGS